MESSRPEADPISLEFVDKGLKYVVWGSRRYSFIEPVTWWFDGDDEQTTDLAEVAVVGFPAPNGELFFLDVSEVRLGAKH